MMHVAEIKQELKIDQLQCHTCLSIGRNLTALGKYVDILMRIALQTPYWTSCNMDAIKICWECKAVLKKMVKFQSQVSRATELLEIGQAYLYGTLSSLTTVISNETHPIVYVTQESEPSHTHTEDLTDSIDNVDHTSDIDTDNIESKTEAIDETQNVKAKVKNNKWAIKRALQNKKPKFRILKDDKVFNKVKISCEERSRFIEQERDSEYFKSSRFKCETCVLAFKNEIALAEHEKSRHSQTVGPYVCDICQTRTSKKISLEIHVRSHNYMYTCKLCGYCTVHKSRRMTHASTHRTVLLCINCEKAFGSRKEFYSHYKEWHEKFICDHCGVSFKMRYCIKQHIRKQHSPFECKLCNKRFSRYNGLWLHNKVCHTESTQSAYCVECDKRYADVYRYRWHLSNSARHRPRAKQRYPCPGCDKVFTKKIYMKDHHDLVHLKKCKYRCDPCDKNYLRNADLVQHRKRVHEGILPPKDKICYICGRGFTTNKILNNHVRTHTGERPFACALCAATFAQRAALAQHTRARHA